MPAYAGNPTLTPKQQRFVESYLLDLNATQAAIRAGYSPRTAQVQGTQLLAHPAIMTAINEGKIARSEETRVNAAWVLRRLAEEAEADFGDLYDDAGDLLPVKQWPKIWRQGLIAGLDVEVMSVEGIEIGRVKKLRISDRVKRLELIGQHVNVQAFKDQIEVGGLGELADRLARAAKRDG